MMRSPLRAADRATPITGRRRRAAVAGVVLAAACSATAGPVKPGGVIDAPPAAGAPTPAPALPRRPVTVAQTAVPAGAAGLPDARTRALQAGERIVRVLVAPVQGPAPITADVDWEVVRPNEFAPVAAGRAGRVWQIERSGRALRIVRPDGVGTASAPGPLILRASGTEVSARMTIAGRMYRGEVVMTGTDSGIAVVNRLPMEDYLRGVVPLEIGRTRSRAELPAAQAQAVAARSFALTRLGAGGAGWDVRATTADQVYGGASAETPLADEAVESTAGLALHVGDRVVNAPYHSTCGGSTASPEEVWRARAEPYLQRVSDRIPGTDRHYCDPSPRFTWTARFAAAALDAAVARHLRTYAAVPTGGAGPVHDVRVATTTPSGRVGTLAIATARGTYTLRGNDIRYVLRPAGGEILNSTYFSVREGGAGGGITIAGRGYGHGIGMCQWGAIGRARAGQDFRTILRTYFPGTTVQPAG